MKTLTLLLAFAVPATASPVTFGSSWDGTPPGTFADLVGGTPELGHPDFAAGSYVISLTAGVSLWAYRDTIGVEGDSVCAVMTDGCPLGGPGTTTQIYLDRPWRLWASTPSYTHQTSNGVQFAFVQTSPTTWEVGLEDIALALGDRDYQDERIMIRRIDSEIVPTPQTSTPTPVPEPFTLVLIGGALTAAQLVRKMRP